MKTSIIKINFFKANLLLSILLALLKITYEQNNTSNTYQQSYSSLMSHPRYQAVSHDGMYFVSSYWNNSSDNFKVFKTQQFGFSQVNDVSLINKRISDLQISNSGQRVIYVDFASNKIYMHQKSSQGKYSTQPDQQIFLSTGPNNVDISYDGNLMVVVGNDTLVKIYKSSGKWSQYYLFQTIDIKNEVVGQIITSTSNFYAVSFSGDLQTLAISGQTGQIYIYQLNGVFYSYYEKIPPSTGNSNHYLTYSLKLNYNGKVLIAATNQNFLSFYRSAKSTLFSIPNIYNDCLLQRNSAFAVAVTDDGNTFCASCYYPSPTHIFKKQPGSNTAYYKYQTINATKDVYSASVSGDGAYLVIGDNGATSFQLYQYYCGDSMYFSLQSSCIKCPDSQCGNCSRISPLKCGQCKNSLIIIDNFCKNCSYYGSTCLACNQSRCNCDSSLGKTWGPYSQNSTQYICKDSTNTAGSLPINVIVPILIGVPLCLVVIIVTICLVRNYLKKKQEQKRVNPTIQDSNQDNFQDSFQSFNNKKLKKQLGSPQKIFTKFKSIEIQQENSNDMQVCSICLIGGVTHFTPCFHYFHIQCIKAWLARQKLCPNCRLPLRTRDIIQLKIQKR